MEINLIQCFLVHPEKKRDEKTTIIGTTVNQEGRLFYMLKGIFEKAPKECTYSIAFLPNDLGGQQNDFRDLILEHIKNGNIDSGMKIALHLQSVTTHRSGLGLLFIMLGQSERKKRIVLSRFPAETGILAEEMGQSLTVTFIEKIFMKNTHAYKSAVFEGISFDSDFWEGQAIDKQITADAYLAHYWINEFLKADFATSGERGTRTLALALRNAVNSAKDILIKEEIISTINLVKGLDRQPVNPSSLMDRFGLSPSARSEIKKHLNHKLYDEEFFFVTDEFNKYIKFKSIKLDNGAMLTADAGDFETIFTSESAGQKGVTFTTTGKIIEEKIKKTNL